MARDELLLFDVEAFADGEATQFAVTPAGGATRHYRVAGGEDGRHHLTLYVPSGRIKDIEGGPQFLSGLHPHPAPCGRNDA